MLTNGNTPVAMSQMPSKTMPQFLFVEFHFMSSLLFVVMAESAVSDVFSYEDFEHFMRETQLDFLPEGKISRKAPINNALTIIGQLDALFGTVSSLPISLEGGKGCRNRGEPAARISRGMAIMAGEIIDGAQAGQDRKWDATVFSRRPR